MRHAVLENDIIAKLLQRIAENRLALTNWYRGVETVTGAGVHTVTRVQWADGLKQVLKLNIPFMESDSTTTHSYTETWVLHTISENWVATDRYGSSAVIHC